VSDVAWYDLNDPQTWGISVGALEKIRRYQVDGVRFLCRPIDELRKSAGYNVRGCLVGDEMGTGKTAEAAIAAQISTPASGIIVVACPTTVTRNWCREIHKWVGNDQAVHVVRGGTDVIPDEARWVIVSFDLLAKQRSAILARTCFTLIGDEGIKIKNGSATRTRGFAALAERVEVSSGCRVHILNGTPIANRIQDLIVPLQLLGHQIVENVDWFKNRYCWSGLNDRGLPTYNGARNVDELRQKLDGIYIQRLRKEVAAELPPMNRRMLEVEPDPTLFRHYKQELREQKAALVSGEESLILPVIGRLKKLTALAKIDRTAEYVDDVMEVAPYEKIVVFSYYPEVLKRLADRYNALQPGRAVVVDGSVAPVTRDGLIEQFQTNPDTQVFLGQIEATGTGVTLTAANHLCFNDFDWRAYIHLQAEDRVNRIGQERPVTVTYMHAAGTIDDHMIERLAQKLNDSNEFARRQAEGNAFREMLLNETSLADEQSSGETVRAIAKELAEDSRL
jgi:SWI/SNF-related matrix-associated actin-dependent regulator of chromatin subfamily A-like protein 1